jgi:hypothetical protein
MASSAVMKRTAWAGFPAADRRAAGRHGGGDLWQRRCQHEGGQWPLCCSWRSPLEAGEQADHNQQAVAAVRTRLTSVKGWAPGIGRLARPCRGCGRWRGCVPRQHELELVQEGTLEGTPQPVVPDLVEALG